MKCLALGPNRVFDTQCSGLCVAKTNHNRLNCALVESATELIQCRQSFLDMWQRPEFPSIHGRGKHMASYPCERFEDPGTRFDEVKCRFTMVWVGMRDTSARSPSQPPVPIQVARTTVASCRIRPSRRSKEEQADVPVVSHEEGSADESPILNLSGAILYRGSICERRMCEFRRNPPGTSFPYATRLTTEP